jgi:hypothetical protein
VSTNVSVNAHLSDIARKVLIVVANPTVSSNNGWPVGSYLIQGRTVTGFSNVEEDYSNRAAGVEINAVAVGRHPARTRSELGVGRLVQIILRP